MIDLVELFNRLASIDRGQSAISIYPNWDRELGGCCSIVVDVRFFLRGETATLSTTFDHEALRGAVSAIDFIVSGVGYRIERHKRATYGHGG